MKERNSTTTFLLEEKILDQASLDRLIQESEATGRSLINILKSRVLINKDQLTELTAVTNNIEFVTLSPDMIDPMAVRLVSYDLARENNLVPVRIEKDTLFVAMSSPLNLSIRDTISTKTGYKVVPLASTAESIKQVISYHFNVESVTKQDIVEMRLKGGPDADLKIKKKMHSARVADAPIVRLVDSIITGAIDARASDIHIEPQEPDMKVRYRVDGILVEALEVPASAQLEVISHIKILADMDISERRIPQDGHVSVQHHNSDYDLRVSSLPGTGGEKIAIRVLDAVRGLKSLQQIVDTSSDTYTKFNSLLRNPYGMILLTGPTGSGKTTTLYSMIQAINTPDKNIVTVEDPVEYRLNGVTQVQVKPSIGMTFASSLRSILRQDPDVILVGEIRDLETAEIAVSAALTGHLVLSTLHTNDAAGAISRLINLGVAPFQLGSSLLGIVAQRLVRTNCSKCKQSYKPSEEEFGFVLGSKGGHQDVELFRGQGCGACHNTGYRGRQGVYEVLEVTSSIKDMIVDRVSDSKIKGAAIEAGMKTLKVEGITQALEGSTTIDELIRVIDMREE